MGTKIQLKSLVLAVIFACTCLFVYGMRKDPLPISKPPLKEYLLHIPGYKLTKDIGLDKDLVEMLKVDDYLYADYQGADGPVNLYIGYYFSAATAYAAHSPLICYPSQGWKIEGSPRIDTLQSGEHTIHFEAIVTSLGEKKELVLYWYQARLKTNNQVYENKIDMGYNKFVHNDEQHCFVRIAVPLARDSYEDAMKKAADFIQAFFPVFAHYILITEQ